MDVPIKITHNGLNISAILLFHLSIDCKNFQKNPGTLVGWNSCTWCYLVCPQSSVETFTHGGDMVLP